MTQNKPMHIYSQYEALNLIKESKIRPEFVSYNLYILPSDNEYLMVVDCIFRVADPNSTYTNVGWEWYEFNLIGYAKNLYAQLDVALKAIDGWLIE